MLDPIENKSNCTTLPRTKTLDGVVNVLREGLAVLVVVSMVSVVSVVATVGMMFMVLPAIGVTVFRFEALSTPNVDYQYRLASLFRAVGGWSRSPIST